MQCHLCEADADRFVSTDFGQYGYCKECWSKKAIYTLFMDGRTMSKGRGRKWTIQIE